MASSVRAWSEAACGDTRRSCSFNTARLLARPERSEMLEQSQLSEQPICDISISVKKLLAKKDWIEKKVH